MLNVFGPKFYKIPFGPLQGLKIFTSLKYGVDKVWGVYDKNASKFISYNLLENESAIVIGGNFGYFTFLASKLVGSKGKVFSILNNDTATQFALKTIKENAIENTKLVSDVKKIKILKKDKLSLVILNHENNFKYLSNLESILESEKPTIFMRFLNKKELNKTAKFLRSKNYTFYDIYKDILKNKDLKKVSYIVGKVV